MKVEQSQFVSELPYQPIKSFYYDQDNQDKRFQNLVIKMLVPSFYQLLLTILASKLFFLKHLVLLFLSLTISAAMSNSFHLALPYQNQSFVIDDIVKGPLYVYVDFPELYDYFILPSTCEIEIDNTNCDIPILKKFFPNINFQILDIDINPSLPSHYSELEQIYEQKFDDFQSSVISTQFIYTDTPYTIFQGRIENDLKQGTYQIIVNSDDNEYEKKIIIESYGYFGNKPQNFVVLNIIFLIITIAILANITKKFIFLWRKKRSLKLTL